MDGKEILGWVLVIIGLAFVLLGFIGAYKAIFDPPQEPPNIEDIGIPWPIIPPLLEAGVWGLCLAVGVLFIVMGLRLLGVDISFTEAPSDSPAPSE